MLRKTWTLLVLAAVGSMVFANVDLRTNIQDIYYRGTCEEAGAVTMSVNGDDFFEASTETPVFIRVRLDKGGLLCDTLVDYQNAPLHINRPVYLAMRLEGGAASNAVIAAPMETVSIVRWIGGEQELWLRVQAASTTWVDFGGLLRPPDVQIRVAWTFGVTARNSYNRNFTEWGALRANLPANTRNTAAITSNPGFEEGWAISTLFCVDVSESILTPMPQLNSELNFDTISYDYQTAGVFTEPFASSIRTGDQTSANFSGDDTIARGFDINCSMTYDKHGLVHADLCLIPGGQGGRDEGLVCMENDIEINIFCDYGWNANSYFYVATPTGAAYGYPVMTNAAGPIIVGYFGGDEVWGVYLDAEIVDPAPAVQGWLAFSFPEDVFVAGGNYLSGFAFVYYLGPDDVAANMVEINLSAVVCMWYDNPPVDVVLTVGAWLTNRGDYYDVFPFDGTVDDGDPGTGTTIADQRQYCPWSRIHVGPIEWDFGSFDPCLSDMVSIFFPYLPKLVDTDYWTGISIVNQGLISFGEGEVIGHIYEADGSLWVVEFPPLPVRHQYTWLVADGDQGVGFYDSDAGIFLPVTAGGGDLVPMDLRSSMFVVAQAEGETIFDIIGPDLDGFCLIGNVVTLVVYGYLPRNYDNDIPFQNADMPILRAKTAPVFDYTMDKTILGQYKRNLWQ
jgi:hypothetical protein